jgi:hypothetical protein
MKNRKPFKYYLKVMAICAISGFVGTMTDKITGNVTYGAIAMSTAVIILLFPFGYLKIHRLKPEQVISGR